MTATAAHGAVLAQLQPRLVSLEFVRVVLVVVQVFARELGLCLLGWIVRECAPVHRVP